MPESGGGASGYHVDAAAKTGEGEDQERELESLAQSKQREQTIDTENGGEGASGYHVDAAADKGEEGGRKRGCLSHSSVADAVSG